MDISPFAILGILFVLWQLLAYIHEARHGKPDRSTHAISVPRCPVCGALSPYGLCPNGHAGTTWVDEPPDPYRNDFDDREDPFANNYDPYR